MKTLLIIGAIVLGIVSGLATIYLIPAQFEIMIWIVLIVTIGFVVARLNEHHFFRKGLLYAIIVGVVITLTHVLLLQDYIASHAEEIEMMQPMVIANSLRVTLIVISPVYWIVLGFFSGLAAVAWAKFYRSIKSF